MKSIFLLIMIFLLYSCNLKENRVFNNTIGDTHEQTQENSLEILELPMIGVFSLTNTEIDSLHEYGAGDCWGTVIKYSLKNVEIAVDTMNCGEYGYTYTYYLINDKGSILTVVQKKLELSFNPDNNSYFHLLQEQIVDFNSEPPNTLTRIDTLCNFLNNEIDKPFERETLVDKQVAYEQWKLKYQNLWKMELLDE